MPKLIENTVVVHPETGTPVLLAATGELPDWAAGLVGDHLLDETSSPTARPSVTDDDEVERLKARIAELESAQGAPGPPAPAGDGPKMPPRQGPGSGADRWRAYAASQGVEVPADASRDDVLVALGTAEQAAK